MEEKKEVKEEPSEKEKRIRAITKLYYSNPKIQEAILKFSQDREVVPRYFEGFGKRPDSIQYPSDIMGLINKGATSLHCSEELWNNPLEINSDMQQEQLSEIRKSWDLLIDIDSPFLDCSKIAAKLIISALEFHGINNYGIKFSGSKGFHIIVSGKAFPKYFEGQETNKMFPEWPRAISEYLMYYIRNDYNREVAKILSESDVIKRTNITEEELNSVRCANCHRPAKQDVLIKFICPVCNLTIDRKNFKLTKRRLRCLNDSCPGVLEVLDQKQYYYCEICKSPENENLQLSSDNHPENFQESRGINAEKIAKLDLVLVASRHLFRMPYSLHEKTSLSSAVLSKEQLDSFSPKDASPFNIKILDYMPNNNEGEATKLLKEALYWKKAKNIEEDKVEKKLSFNKKYEKLDIKGVTEAMFPQSIIKLLKGLNDGKKRGLFILITFFKSLNFSPEYINEKIRSWNKLNNPPLKEGYVKSQINWHLKQRKQILPPNYDNESFYKDLNLLDKKPETKNPIVDVLRKLRNSQANY